MQNKPNLFFYRAICPALFLVMKTGSYVVSLHAAFEMNSLEQEYLDEIKTLEKQLDLIINQEERVLRDLVLLRKSIIRKGSQIEELYLSTIQPSDYKYAEITFIDHHFLALLNARYVKLTSCARKIERKWRREAANYNVH